jgi:hypothetical protein
VYLLLVLALFGPTRCWPALCLCASDASNQTNVVVAAVEEMDAVFSGRVTRTARVRGPEHWLETTLEIEARWKGEEVKQVKVRTPWFAALCGFPFEHGKQYLVYAVIEEDGRLYTDACTRTKPLEQAEDEILQLDRIVGHT